MSDNGGPRNAASPGRGAVTAGLRGAAWNPALVPEDMVTRVMPCATQDGASVTGYLHSRGGERAVAFIMHPREILVTHYLVPYLVRAGYACWVQGPRTPGNDLLLEHEFAVHDVGAGMRRLRDLGFKSIIMVGNSGGASLFAFYNQQARAVGADRIAMTPAGRLTKLTEADLPIPDGFALLAPHPGQGKLLQGMIDPSVTDEADPLSCDAALDPFDRANGFRPASAGGARYAPAFLEKYRAAQRDRVARIDAFARTLLARKSDERQRLKAGETLGFYAGKYSGIFQVWRTDADPRSFDLSLDPSDRRWGSVWGANPAVSNVGAIGFGRLCTPESWLSTWSGLSSNASFDLCGGALVQPALMVEYSGDTSVFPSDGEAIFAGIGSSEKTRHAVRGDHHGRALGEGEPDGQPLAAACIIDWMQERWK